MLDLIIWLTAVEFGFAGVFLVVRSINRRSAGKTRQANCDFAAA